jgi:transcriptional regulator with XRE-family HTH domain
MGTNKIGFFSTGSGVLATVGENIKLARIGRRLTVYKVSKMVGISRSTLWEVEKGSPKVAMGIYYEVLFILGLADDLLKIGANDLLGRKSKDFGILTRKTSRQIKSEDMRLSVRKNKYEKDTVSFVKDLVGKK